MQDRYRAHIRRRASSKAAGRPCLSYVGGLTSGKEENKDTTTYAGRIYSTGTCLSYAVCRRAQLELASACRRWNWTSRPCHACISHRHHSCMHVPRGWIWTILVHTLVCQWPFVRDRVEHWRSRAAVAVGSRRKISRWCRSAGAGGGTAAIDPFLYVRVVVPLPTRTPHIYVPGRAGLPAACGGAWYGYDTVRYGAVCSPLACLTVRRRRARLRT